MDSTAQIAPRDSEISNELLSRVTQVFDSTNIPKGLRNHQRTAVTGDAGIRQPPQPLGTHITNKVLSRVTHGFDCPNSP